MNGVLADGPPPFGFAGGAAGLAWPRAHGGRLRVLGFGRLLAYKGLDLLAATLRLLDQDAVEVRVVGRGPESAALAALRAIPWARVENRWVAEAEVPALLGWADVLLLTHATASQSGVAAAGIGAGRFVVATDAGGLRAQLAGVAGARVVPADPAALAAAVLAARSAPVPAVPDSAASWRGMASSLLGVLSPRGGIAQRGSPHAVPG